LLVVVVVVEVVVVGVVGPLHLPMGSSILCCRQVLSFGGVRADDIEPDEKRSSEINGEGCAPRARVFPSTHSPHPSSRKQAPMSSRRARKKLHPCMM
jgi:hypothetical protein